MKHQTTGNINSTQWVSQYVSKLSYAFVKCQPFFLWFSLLSGQTGDHSGNVRYAFKSYSGHYGVLEPDGKCR
jgi:hypothetical protein